jgi:hypothetical protein
MPQSEAGVDPAKLQEQTLPALPCNPDPLIAQRDPYCLAENRWLKMNKTSCGLCHELDHAILCELDGVCKQVDGTAFF